MTNKARIALTVLALGALLPLGAAAWQQADIQPPLFADVWIGGPLDSLYNAEYQRLQTACAGAEDECYRTQLDTTVVQLAPVFSSPDGGEPAGWLAAQLRTEGRWPFGSLLFVSAEGRQEPLIDDLGDWGYGSLFELAEARDGWVRPWLLDPVGGYWLGPEFGRGLGIVDGPYGLEGRLWLLGPISADESSSGSALAEGVYMILEVEGGRVTLRAESPMDMPCEVLPDSIASRPPPPTHEVPLRALLDATGRPNVDVAYGRGC